MILFPAIDIKSGKVVRLKQGLFNKVTEYSDNPAEVAQKWENQGAQWIHVVDLDGAKSGKVKNLSIIAKVAQSVDIPIQMGGGVRTKEDIRELFAAGVGRVILGTKAVEDREFLKELVAQWPQRIAVSVDCSNGMVTQKGWTQVTEINAIDFVTELEDLGLRCLIYTDIKRDGMLTGPNFEALEELLSSTGVPVIASGGIAKLEDVQKLAELESMGVIGAITGKAIYEGTLDFKEALKVC
ncbi:MAG: 1-(5-phosphoribosyl)-5-[(5-phosphoribosylamino)methylideneamino]imidazole-4-carboxamide isomerase [Candidatus Omnitrophica bacterium]|nr:1-(5-phosphoribosyl)-5-[(5-phosphoribosylamino)methylideneamino]imidazole-4-carboxamide isomerase [Candidatus Omnitrophota bacterium]